MSSSASALILPPSSSLSSLPGPCCKTSQLAMRCQKCTTSIFYDNSDSSSSSSSSNTSKPTKTLDETQKEELLESTKKLIESTKDEIENVILKLKEVIDPANTTVHRFPFLYNECMYKFIFIFPNEAPPSLSAYQQRFMGYPQDIEIISLSLIDPQIRIEFGSQLNACRQCSRCLLILFDRPFTEMDPCLATILPGAGTPIDEPTTPQEDLEYVFCQQLTERAFEVLELAAILEEREKGHEKLNAFGALNILRSFQQTSHVTMSLSP